MWKLRCIRLALYEDGIVVFDSSRTTEFEGRSEARGCRKGRDMVIEGLILWLLDRTLGHRNRRYRKEWNDSNDGRMRSARQQFVACSCSLVKSPVERSQ